jgi:hypothetical protein
MAAGACFAIGTVFEIAVRATIAASSSDCRRPVRHFRRIAID